MAMHWRAGFRRIRRATAGIYLLAAVLTCGGQFLTNVWVPKQTFEVRVPEPWAEFREPPGGGTRTVWVTAYSIAAANQALSKADKAGKIPDFVEADEPRRFNISRAWTETEPVLLGFAGFYVAAWALFRLLRWVGRGFLDGEPMAKQAEPK